MKNADKYEVRTLRGKELFPNKEKAVDYARWIFENTGSKYIAIYYKQRLVEEFEESSYSTEHTNQTKP